MGVHSTYSPSASWRWLNCPGSVHLTDQDRAVLAQRDTSAADRGTLGHAIAEAQLRGEHDKAEDLASEADSELLEGIEFCLEEVSTRFLPGRISLEERIESTLIPGFGGTMDVLAFGDEALDVADYKFGFSPVPIEENTQILCYLLLAREKYPEYKRYRGTIIQPAYESVGTVEVTDEELDAFFVRVIEATLSDDLRAGPHCKYCPLLYRCEVAAKEVWEAVSEAPGMEDIPAKPDQELISRSVRAYKAYKLAEAAVKDLRHIIEDWIDKGLFAPGDQGLKVSAYDRRYWRPEAEEIIAKDVGDAAFERKLLGPAKVQKLLGVSKEDLAKKYSDILEVRGSNRITISEGSEFDDLTR